MYLDAGSIPERSMLRGSTVAKTISVVLQHAYRSPRDAQRAGGDFALARRHLDGAITFIVMDLWAKAREAEHYTACMKHAFNVLSLTALSPAPLLSLLNRFFFDELRARAETEGSASAFCANCDAWGQLRYAAAGTDGGLLFRGSDSPHYLEPTGPLLGIGDYASYGERGFTFWIGDLLVVCTDGITEAPNGGSGRDLLGTHGLADIMGTLIRTHDPPRCEDLIERVAELGDGNFRDDATAVFASPQWGQRDVGPRG